MASSSCKDRGHVRRSDMGGCALNQRQFSTCGICALSSALCENLFDDYGLALDEKHTMILLQGRNLKNADGTLIADDGVSMPHLVMSVNNALADGTMVFILKNVLELSISISVEAVPDAEPGNIILAGQDAGSEMGHFMLVDKPPGFLGFFRLFGFGPSQTYCKNSWGSDALVKVPGDMFQETRFVYKLTVSNVRVRSGGGVPFKPVHNIKQALVASCHSHALSPVELSNHVCDVCDKSLKQEVAFRCSACDYDICNACMDQCMTTRFSNCFAHAFKVPHRARVYIKVFGENIWLAKQPSGTYCAAAGSKEHRAAFIVEKWGPGLQLKYDEPSNYLEANKFLYAATTGSTKYGEDDAKNTKFYWMLDSNGSTDLCYNTETSFLDAYVYSYMAVNTTESACSYAGGHGKVWVEAKYARHIESNFRAKFVVLAAP